ncbi:type II secretion system F family protein [Candidatus Peregrinibacteria bacterium]|nr:type II secretion system F family protein [Candidatus Peregrinibacteria bacterium]
MNPPITEKRQGKLDLLLSRLQKESASDEFIYGVTNRVGRGFFTKIRDFFIDNSGVSGKEKAYFFELLGTMIKSGIPLNRSLKILKTKTDSLRLRRVISTLSNDLEHGYKLSAAMDRFPDIFDQTERGAIMSAEAVGHLEGMLFKIAENLYRRADLVSRLQAALVYPLAVIFSLTVAISVMMIFVVPRMEELFSQSSLALPFATRFLLKSSAVITNFWWLFLIVLIFSGITFHFYVNSEDGRFGWDFRKLRLPVIGKILRKIIVIRFVDTLGVLIESGLPINKTLEYVAAGTGNEIYRLKTFEALGAVQEGRKISESLSLSPFLFPEAVTNMLAVGEQTATLGDISRKIGNYLEKEIDNTLKNFTTVLGPLLILFVGVMVAFFALAVLSPIFSLTQAAV